MIRIPMASAGDKGFASRGQGPREDLGPLPPDLGGDALEVRVECLGELLAGRLGPRRPEIPKRLDAAPAALLVMPEIQVWPSANRFRRHATTDLHASDIRLTLLRVNAPGPPGQPGWPHPSISTGNVHGGPTPSDGRWTSSWCPSRRTWGKSRPCWRPRAIGSSRRLSSAGTARTAARSWAAGSSTRSRPASTPAGSTRACSTASSRPRSTNHSNGVLGWNATTALRAFLDWSRKRGRVGGG